MQQEIKNYIPSVVFDFASIFAKHNKKCYLVGGSIRDILISINRGSSPEFEEFDIATDAKPEEVKGMFKKVVPTGIKHGTVSVFFKKKLFEVTTLRKEGKYTDRRHPDKVEFVSDIDTDLGRRDFTINAIAYNPNSNEVIDLFNGIKDIKNGIIKAIGNPDDRFKEDALRLIRAIRFMATLDFDIEKNTYESIKRNASLIKDIAIERVKDELVKILKAQKPSVAFKAMLDTGLLKHIIPELVEGVGITQNEYHIYDVFHHNIYTCDAAPRDNLVVRLAGLLHDIGKSRAKKIVEKDGDEERVVFYNHEVIGARMSKKILKRLRFPNSIINKVSHLIYMHMFYYKPYWTDGAVRRFMRSAGVENLNDLFLLRVADRIGNGKKKAYSKSLEELKMRIQRIIDEQNAITVRDLNINGNDIMKELNLKPGPQIGKILNYLLEMVLDNPELNEKEKLLKLARDFLASNR